MAIKQRCTQCLPLCCRQIRLTGGEPTVRPDLLDLCRGLSSISGMETLAMTSNGIKLAKQLPLLKAAGKWDLWLQMLGTMFPF